MQTLSFGNVWIARLFRFSGEGVAILIQFFAKNLQRRPVDAGIIVV